MNNKFMVFFQSHECDLSGALQSLQTYNFNVFENQDFLIAQRGDSQNYKITLSEGDSVNIEAKNVSENTDFYEAMQKSDAKFEVVVDDLDAALDEINTLMELQGALQDASKGYLFVVWSGEIMEPWLD